MKICCFSDIHGNADAFRVACDMILEERADLNIFLGDLCGYYYDALEVFELVCRLPALIAVRGNHDQMFLDILAGDEKLFNDYKHRYGSALELLLKQDHSALAQWLAGLPETYADDALGLYCCHGSPENPLNGYLYPDTDIGMLAKMVYTNFIFGHTHRPMQRMLTGKMVLNPGSLGQPRQGGWPTYAVLDCDNSAVVFREVRYDKNTLIGKVEAVGDINPYLKEVLLRGRHET